MLLIPAILHRWALRIAHPLARVFWRLTHPSVSGAYVIVARDHGTPNEAWLFVTNTYKPGFTLPGGGIESDESQRAAARRETLEEVGLEFDESRFALIDDFEIEYLHRTDHVYFFEVVLRTGETSRPSADQREVAWAGFCRRADVDRRELVAPVRRFLERQDGQRDGATPGQPPAPGRG